LQFSAFVCFYCVLVFCIFYFCAASYGVIKNDDHVLRVVCASGSDVPAVQPNGGDLYLFRTTVEAKKGEQFLGYCG